MIILSDAVGMKIPLISDLLSSIGTVTFDNEINSGGVGDRFVLWQWVALSVGNKWLLGKGVSTEFAYKVYEWQTKTSIENQYLNLLYHYGIIGLISMIWVYIQLFVKAVIQAVKNPSEWEGRISFPKMLAVILGTYYISFFGVHQIDEKRIFFCLIFLCEMA